MTLSILACSEFFLKVENSKDLTGGEDSMNKPIWDCFAQTVWLEHRCLGVAETVRGSRDERPRQQVVSKQSLF